MPVPVALNDFIGGAARRFAALNGQRFLAAARSAGVACHMFGAVPIQCPHWQVTVAPPFPARLCLGPVGISLVSRTMKNFQRLAVDIQRTVCFRRGLHVRKSPGPGTWVSNYPSAD